ncbi:MAG: aldo/keto reductase [Gammaproteobacteria bacterium]|nr:aldo/keto reductase [Gammaproteobacteria bacterium]
MIDSPYQPLDGEQPSMPWLWLGTWSMGGEGFGFCDARESQKLLESAVEKGVRHFDTAGFYAHGKSEQLLANVMRQQRRQLFIASKGGLIWQGRNVHHRASAAALRDELQRSLERLRTDYLDLYQLHWPDPNVALEESLEALQLLQQEGLIRYWGVCNLSADQLRTHIPVGAYIPHQVHHNPIHRNDEVLQVGIQHKRCFNCCYSPLEQGLLADGVGARGLNSLGKRDVRRSNSYFCSERVRAWLGEYREIIEASPIDSVTAALLWSVTAADVQAVVVGPKKLHQLEQMLAHVQWVNCAEGQLSIKTELTVADAGRWWQCLESGADRSVS